MCLDICVQILARLERPRRLGGEDSYTSQCSVSAMYVCMREREGEEMKGEENEEEKKYPSNQVQFRYILLRFHEPPLSFHQP